MNKEKIQHHISHLQEKHNELDNRISGVENDLKEIKDLLLGLMVIFLATISFVPIDNFISKSLVKATYKQVDKAFNFNRGISLIYNKFDAVALERDITAFKNREGLDNNAEIIFAQILGGYDPKTETADDGRSNWY